MTEVRIQGFPMPPSQNAAYKNLNIAGRAGRAKSQDYRSFEVAAAAFSARNHRQIMQARSMCEALKAGTVLEVEYLFRFHDILMKNNGKQPKRGGKARLKGEPRTNDTSNRIKVLEDVLSRLLGIDDCWFWAGSYNKIQETQPFFEASVDIVLRLRSIDARGDLVRDEGLAESVRQIPLN